MFIEALRLDSLYVGVFRISQVLAFACFVVGSIILIYKLSKARREKLTEADYEPTYPKFSHMPLRSFNTEDSDSSDDNNDDNTDNTNEDKGE